MDFWMNWLVGDQFQNDTPAYSILVKHIKKNSILEGKTIIQITSVKFIYL